MLSTVERVLFLKQIDLFRSIPGEYLAEIARITREIAFNNGEVLMQEGDLGDYLYLIVSGTVSVTVKGREVARLSQRDCVGEMAILDSEPRSATVTATQNVVALQIDRDDFYRIMHERTEIAEGIIKVLTHRLRARLETVAAK